MCHLNWAGSAHTPSQDALHLALAFAVGVVGGAVPRVTTWVAGMCALPFLVLACRGLGGVLGAVVDRSAGVAGWLCLSRLLA